MCDLILKESNNVIVFSDYNCNFMSEKALKDLCTSFGIHNIVNLSQKFGGHTDQYLSCVKTPLVQDSAQS